MDVHSALIFYVPKQSLNDFYLEEKNDIVEVLKMSLKKVAPEDVLDNDAEEVSVIFSVFSKKYEISIIVDYVDWDECGRPYFKRKFYNDGAILEYEGIPEMDDNYMMILKDENNSSKQYYLPFSGAWFSEFLIEGKQKRNLVKNLVPLGLCHIYKML